MITDFINDGNNYPTVGISFGLSSIYEILKDNEMFINNSDIDIFIIPIETEIESLKIANKLRNLGYKVEIEMRNKKLKKSLEFADKENIKYVIILGMDEINNGIFKLKDMNNKIEYDIELSEIEKIYDIINL